MMQAMAGTALSDYRRLMSQELASRLSDEIIDGSLPPGTWLRQNEIADRYGTSTTPVREAFKLLEQEGLVRSTAHRGVVVHEPTLEEMRELNLIRIPLEVTATEHAVPRLTKADLTSLRRSNQALRDARRDDDQPAAIKANSEFHLTIYAAAGLPRLYRLILELRRLSDAYHRLGGLWGPAKGWERSPRQHKELIDACAAGDGRRAAELMRRHLDDGYASVREKFEQAERSGEPLSEARPRSPASRRLLAGSAER